MSGATFVAACMSATVQSPRPPPSLGLLGVRSHLLLSGWVTVSGSCRSGAPGVGFLQPRMRQVIVQGGLGGPCVVLGRVGQSPGPFVTLALEAQTSVLGGLAGPPPGSLAARRPRVTCPGPAGPGVQRPGSSARGPRVRPVTPLPPGQRPHRTTASDPGARREKRAVLWGPSHLCALQNRRPVSAQLCQVPRRLQGRAGIVTGALPGDCSQRRATGPWGSSLLVPTRPRTLWGSHGGDACPAWCSRQVSPGPCVHTI